MKPFEFNPIQIQQLSNFVYQSKTDLADAMHAMGFSDYKDPEVRERVRQKLLEMGIDFCDNCNHWDKKEKLHPVNGEDTVYCEDCFNGNSDDFFDDY